MSNLKVVKAELKEMRDFFLKVVNIIPSFHIADPDILPYGLKPHTRSVSWIVEQVIVQQAKYNRNKLGVEDVNFELPDTCLHDCEVVTSEKKYFVNIKLTGAGVRRSKKDIAAVEKLYAQYKANPAYRLIYAVFQFSFDNTNIIFDKDKMHTFSPQFLPIYVNPRNDKIQANYYALRHIRSRKQFLDQLVKESRSIRLG